MNDNVPMSYSPVLDTRFHTETWKDGVNRPCLKEMKLAIERSSRFTMAFTFVSNSTAHPVVACEIRDAETNTQVMRIGELDSPTGSRPVTDAADQAFYKAAVSILQIRMETSPAIKSDDTILLIAGMKGKRYGDVKGTEEFAKYLEQLRSNPDIRFPDRERMEQLSLLMKMATKG